MIVLNNTFIIIAYVYTKAFYTERGFVEILKNFLNSFDFFGILFLTI